MVKIEVKQIIEIALRHNGIVFGGFLRDKIAGNKPRDLDLFFSEEKAVHAFTFELMENAPWRRAIVAKGYYNGMQCAVTHHRLISPHMTEVEYIDVLYSSHGVQKLPWAYRRDADVNMLWRDRRGLYVYGSDLDLFEIIRNCQTKQFVELSGMTEKRRQKLLAAGWTRKS